ncbi:hypothetical protein [Bartonella harrusi]|uniref:Uncharacterized protein n=1 Tax=Bartonella harrusi TaxID=2961895 RepID=A0ABY5EW11_9HYPH|nr:hypothetical protein [Bartonella harrusi]UTO28058.1 hypothetical protein NMK50_07580 [Bartonella harrusi]
MALKVFRKNGDYDKRSVWQMIKIDNLRCRKVQVQGKKREGNCGLANLIFEKSGEEKRIFTPLDL